MAPVATSNAQEYPNYEWKFVDDPGKAGWVVSSLVKLRGFLITNTGVTACMIIRNEKVIFSFGDVQENSLIASCRKSVLSILYGKHVKSGEISWMHEMLTARTQCTEINAHIEDFRNTDYNFGYGYMWWIWQNTDDPRFNGSYMALGNMGQCIAVFPAVNVVIVYKTKPIYERETPFAARFKIFSLAIESLKQISPQP